MATARSARSGRRSTSTATTSRCSPPWNRCRPQPTRPSGVVRASPLRVHYPAPSAPLREPVRQPHRALSRVLPDKKGISMDLFQQMVEMGHERVLFCSNPDVGLEAIIAVHSTVLGPGLGGVRMWPYSSTEEAFIDVLRLSRG